MSTILEVLRKAQEDARPKAGGVGEVPGGLLDGARRRRKRFAWGAVVVVLVVGFAGGWWIGSRPRSDAPDLVAEDDAAPEPQAAIARKIERAAEPAVGQPAEAPLAAPTAQPARVERKPIPAAPGDASVAARPDSQPAMGGRELARVAPAPADGAPPRIGERQQPAYVEQQPGPSGEGTPRLRPIPRPGTRPGPDLDGASPVAPPPAGNAVAQAPTMPAAPGSFRDASEVRLEPEPAPAAPSAPPGRESPSELRNRRAAIADRGLSADASPDAPTNPERGATLGATRPAEQPSRVAPAIAEARLASLPPASRPASVAADPDAALLASALRHAPNGAPDVVINIVQWSATPTRRFAYVRVDGSQMMQVHEGDEIGGLTVKRIFQQAVEFAHGGSSFVLRAN